MIHYKKNLKISSFSRIEYVSFVFFLLFSNLLLGLAWHFNTLPAAAGVNWVDKSRAILSLIPPSDNYYPPGSGLLVIPFMNMQNVSLYSTFFWANIGFIFYFLICRVIKSRFWNLFCLITFFINVYLFWNLKSSQDTVFEFALVMISIYLLIKNIWWAAFISLFLLFQIRSAYLLLFILVFVVILLRRKHLRYKKRVLILPILLFILSATFNQQVYGTISPSSPSGQTFYFGQNKYFYFAHPSFDADVFLANGNHMTPDGYTNEKLWSLNYKEVDAIMFNQAIKDILENPEVLIQNTILKIDNIFFNLQKIPHLPGQHVLAPDATYIKIDQHALTLKYALGNFFYFIYRLLSVILLVYALSIWFFNRKFIPKAHLDVPIWLLLPFASWVPLLIYFSEDTRLRIVPECLFIPASAYLMTQVRKLMDQVQLKSNLTDD